MMRTPRSFEVVVAYRGQSGYNAGTAQGQIKGSGRGDWHYRSKFVSAEKREGEGGTVCHPGGDLSLSRLPNG